MESQGCIVNVVSAAGRIAIPGGSPYTGSKFALNGYTDALRREVARYNVRVVSIEPGFVDTPLLDAIKPGTSDDSKTQFKEVFTSSRALVEAFTRKGFLKTEQVAVPIAEQLFSRYPTPHKLVDRLLNRLMILLLTSLPHAWADFISDTLASMK